MTDQQQLKKIAEGREAEMFAWENGTVLRLLREGFDTAGLDNEARAYKAASNAGLQTSASAVTLVTQVPPFVAYNTCGMAQEQRLKKIAEGREAEMFAWEDGTILRLLRNAEAQRQNELQASAMESARASGVRVPDVIGLTTVMGRPGMIMERIDGIDLLTLVGKQPWLVYSIGRISGEVHAALHNVVASEELPALRPSLRARIQSSRQLPEHLARFAMGVLDTLPDGDKLCHGDFHPGNMLRTKEGPIVIDWTNATRGDPTFDYARTLLMIRMGEPPPGAPIVVRVGARFARVIMLWGYQRAYQQLRPIDSDAVSRWYVPVAAARIADGIESEVPGLIRFLEKAHTSSA